MQQHFRKNLMALAIAAALGGGSGVASAAGFALIEQSASGMGNAFAGSAATAEDASTVFFNPAGMSRLEGRQFAVAGHAVNVSAEFADNGSSSKPGAIPALPAGGNGGNAGDLAVVPNVYFSMPIGERLSMGIGVNVPFGLKTEYDETWIGRFQGIKSEIMTINLNPSLAYKVNETISVGVGLNYQQLDAELTNAAVLAPNTEGRARLEADDDGYGWNAGVLIQASPSTRIGLSYRSTIDYTLEGDVTVTDPTGAVVGAASGAATADVTLPDMFSVSLVQTISDKIDVLADVTFTRWSEIQTVSILNPANGTTRDTLVLNFDDSFRYSLGLNYKCTDRFTGKIGVAFDETPVNDQDRTVRLPDTDRKWIAVGGSYRVGSTGKLDLGYAHLFLSDAPIDQTRGSAATNGRVAGSYEGSIDILSIQYSMIF